MYQLIMTIHVFAAACLVLLVLVQQGKGAATGAAFGSGASQTVFGSRGSTSFLLRVTMAFVAVFFSTSIYLNYLATTAQKQQAQALPFNLPAPKTNTVTPNSIPVSAPVKTTPNSASKPSNQVTPNSIPMSIPQTGAQEKKQ